MITVQARSTPSSISSALPWNGLRRRSISLTRSRQPWSNGFPSWNRRGGTIFGKLLRGWTVAATAIVQSGAPFSLLSGGYVIQPDGSVVAVTGLGTMTSQADSGENTVTTSLTAGQIQQFLGIRKTPGGVVSYVNAPATAFREPDPGTVGNLQRRMFNGPGAVDLNFGLLRSIPLKEPFRAEFRAEAINLLNRVDWLVNDQALLGNDLQNGSATFSNGVTQWNSPRTLQFSLRLTF